MNQVQTRLNLTYNSKEKHKILFLEVFKEDGQKTGQVVLYDRQSDRGRRVLEILDKAVESILAL